MKRILAILLCMGLLSGLTGCIKLRDDDEEIRWGALTTQNEDSSQNTDSAIPTVVPSTLPETDPLFDPNATLETQIDLTTYGLKFNLPADWSIVSSDRLSTYLLSADENMSLTVIHDLELIDGAPPTFDDPSVLYEDLSFLLPTQCIRAPINGKTGYAVDYWPTPNKTQFEKFETESLFLNSKIV